MQIMSAFEGFDSNVMCKEVKVKREGGNKRLGLNESFYFSHILSNGAIIYCEPTMC